MDCNCLNTGRCFDLNSNSDGPPLVSSHGWPRSHGSVCASPPCSRCSWGQRSSRGQRPPSTGNCLFWIATGQPSWRELGGAQSLPRPWPGVNSIPGRAVMGMQWNTKGRVVVRGRHRRHQRCNSSKWERKLTDPIIQMRKLSPQGKLNWSHMVTGRELGFQRTLPTVTSPVFPITLNHHVDKWLLRASAFSFVKWK